MFVKIQNIPSCSIKMWVLHTRWSVVIANHCKLRGVLNVCTKFRFMKLLLLFVD